MLGILTSTPLNSILKRIGIGVQFHDTLQNFLRVRVHQLVLHKGNLNSKGHTCKGVASKRSWTDSGEAQYAIPNKYPANINSLSVVV